MYIESFQCVFFVLSFSPVADGGKKEWFRCEIAGTRCKENSPEEETSDSSVYYIFFMGNSSQWTQLKVFFSCIILVCVHSF